MTARLRLLRALCVAGACCALAAPADAQRRRATSAPSPEQAEVMAQLARLREAATAEAAGNLPLAERITREVLTSNPTSLTALITLERLLGLQGRLSEIVPWLDALLEVDPASIVGHQARLRVFSDLDDAARIDAAARSWIEVSPAIETPYREIAAVWRRRGDDQKALAVLKQGRDRVERADGLALELGDVYAALGDDARAAAEWNRAVGTEGRGFMLVQRRLQARPDGGARIVPMLVDELARAPISNARLRSAALLAIAAGMEQRALRIARDLAAVVPIEQRDPLLVELARRADGAGLYRVAAWAYDELLESAANPGSRLAIQTRIAEIALLAGDTALAAETYRELENAAAEGSPQRRQAIALRIQLAARDGDIATATTDLHAFRTEYPHAPELTETASAIAALHMDAGDLATAERVLAGVSGAGAARLRGRLLIRRGDVEAARNELLTAAPQLHGIEATETIAMAALLMRVSAAGAEIVARVLASADDRGSLIRSAAAEAADLPAAERAAVLEFLAGSADRAGLDEDADALRRRIADELPASVEAPAALLSLARRSLATADETEQARVLLERLIMDYPRSALAPQARGELQRLGKGL